MKTKTQWITRIFCLSILITSIILISQSCEKENDIEQHDAVIWYYYINKNNPQWKTDTLNKYAADKHIRNIYITVAPGESFKNASTENISALRYDIQDVMNISPKFSGRGNFDFTPGVCAYGDSMDLVKMGFTINQQNQR